MARIHFQLLVVVGTLLTGCASTPDFVRSVVDSYALPEAGIKNRYVLLSGVKDVGLGDLQFQEFAGYTDRVLADRGFIKAESLESANIAIFLTYAIGDPQTYQYTYSIPTFGQTGTVSSQTTGNFSNSGGSTTYKGTTTYTPQYGITGYQAQTATGVNYTRFMSLEAYDVQAYLKENRMAQVWKISAVSTGPTGDLRYIVPYMATAIRPHVGTSTGRKVEMVVRETDPAFLRLRAEQ